ncbi:hypothetical protein JG688_00013342 [Phytophthora aleatoria]|uniref:Uncharacterized protein n=1 Tax=Phytophthora aleatoria TaxID=2496075 RepID=A0A8J5I9C6_9STRA|nr:hypothetical protein JG688_00013342 [Phytophthora aleatoria]
MESKHEYTQGEKRMIVHSFDYFKGLKDQKIFKGMSTRKLVADCLDYQLTDIEPTIRQFIERENKAVRPTTATGISIHLYEETGILLGERTMQRVLCELDYRYVKGENRHMYADSEANIAFAMSICRGGNCESRCYRGGSTRGLSRRVVLQCKPCPRPDVVVVGQYSL